MMKTKLKTPEIAQKNGAAFIKKLLKKFLKEDIVEPSQFFYHSAFDFGGQDGPQPLMYIGIVPTAWKKWIKSNQCKTSKEFAAGRCIYDAQSKELKLEVKMGKGGKAAVLKIIQKQLLKPFAKAVFVESVDQPETAVEDAPDAIDSDDTTAQMEASQEEAFDIAEFIDEAKSFFSEGSGIQSAITALANGIGKTLKDVSKIVVTDSLIDEAKSAKDDLFDLNILDFINEKLDWLNGLPLDVKEDDNFKSELQKVEKVEKSLKSLASTQQNLINQCDLVAKVAPPTSAANPPISSNPLSNFGQALNKHESQLT